MSGKIYNKQVGRKGETIAENFLKAKRYKVIERNFSTKFGEIDLICKDAETTIFIEVKTKKGIAYGSPEEMFTKNKWTQVKKIANIYLQGNEVLCRIDMIAVVLNKDEMPLQITHYENVVM